MLWHDGVHNMIKYLHWIYGCLLFKSDIFKTINEYDPKLWMWLGDAAYLDDVAGTIYKSDSSMPFEYVKERYQQTQSDPYYQALQNSTQIIGIYDDHDYGINNGDHTFYKKDLYRKLFLDFIREPKDSLRSRETHRGIYQDYILQHEGVKMLDSITTKTGQTIDSQKSSTSGLSVLCLRIGMPISHLLAQEFSSYLRGMARMLSKLVTPQKQECSISSRNLVKVQSASYLLLNYQSGVVFLSGDVHYAQFFQTSCESYVGYNILEICSSGLTHYLSQASPYVEHFIEGHTPQIYKESEIFMNLNFATLELQKFYDIENDQQDFELKFQIRNYEGEAVETRTLLLKRDLQVHASKKRYSNQCEYTHTQGKKVLMIGRIVQSFLEIKHLQFIGQFFLLFSIMMLLPLSIFVRLLGLVHKVYKDLNREEEKQNSSYDKKTQ